MASHCAIALWAAVVLVLCSRSAAEITVADLVDQINRQQIRHYLDDCLYTHLGDNRGMAGPQHDLCRDFIVAEFQSMGLTTTLETFPNVPEQVLTGSVNVIATKPGLVRPQDIWIISAHYDSRDNPGADDNASGCAGVLEIARILTPHDFEATIRFITFDTEELNRSGSRAYAEAHQADNILGVINFDMIANSLGTNQIRVICRAYVPLMDDMAAAVLLYGQGVIPLVIGVGGGTDADSFIYWGFQAASYFEPLGNPTYHTLADSVDTPGNIDYTYAWNITRSAAGLLAAKAVLLPGTDTAAPSWTGDLVAHPSMASGAVDLAWTAPADWRDGGSGPHTCIRYDLRYSTSPILYNDDDATWNAATPAIVAAPHVPGTRESCTVTGLAGGTTYYFALKAIDGFNNASQVSNSAEGKASVVGRRILQNGREAYSGQTDSYIVNGSSNNYGTSPDLVVRGYAAWDPGYIRRGLLRFDLSGIPASPDLNLARLYLYSYDPGRAGGHSGLYGVYPLTQDWSATEVHWTQALAGVNWTNPGGDFLPQPDATAAKVSECPTWYEFDVTAQVRSWLGGTGPQYGWIVKCTDENLLNRDCFYSSEGPIASLRPYLLISDMTDPVPGDFNGDGSVEVVDLLMMVDSFGATCGVDRSFDPRCDLSGDGTVDVLDLLMLIDYWPETSPSTLPAWLRFPGGGWHGSLYSRPDRRYSYGAGWGSTSRSDP